MGWNDNPFRGTADDMENLAHPPSGGRIKMILCGVILPLGVAYMAWGAWIDEEAIWFGGRMAGDVTMKGKAAKGLALCWAGAAGFLHFRYFWGLWPAHRVFSVGVSLSIILGLGGCGAAAYHALM